MRDWCQGETAGDQPGGMVDEFTLADLEEVVKRESAGYHHHPPPGDPVSWTSAPPGYEPLDLRPPTEPWMLRPEYGVCPEVGDSPGLPDILDDDQLIRLTVRELNKKLHGYPREEVARLKQKRRTLKNRGYAQNCRTKRLAQRHELEDKNRLQEQEIARLRAELDRTRLERDYYKRWCGAQQAAAHDNTDHLRYNYDNSP
ncbi:MAF [Cordylochernes scorpioides]|uniref:MAF n=1 Tax=Cordylochernes scorpioides TaxID=51811 RepID=A0ABY6LJ53_9ARAC|nr:MAF [Cordylochernes scorpioides]